MNSKQFKDSMRNLWMPRLVERIQAAATATTTTSVAANNTHTINNRDKLLMKSSPTIINDEFVSSQPHMTQSYSTQEYNNTSSSSNSFGNNKVSTTLFDLDDNSNYYTKDNNPNPNLDYYQPSHQHSFSDCIMEPNTPWIMQSGDSSDIFWNAENMLFLQQQLMNDTM